MIFFAPVYLELHHIDGNHNNWDNRNLLAIDRSCHQYIHMEKSESKDFRKPSAMKVARSNFKERDEA
jgi:hypothetical protein